MKYFLEGFRWTTTDASKNYEVFVPSHSWKMEKLGRLIVPELFPTLEETLLLLEEQKIDWGDPFDIYHGRPPTKWLGSAPFDDYYDGVYPAVCVAMDSDYRWFK